MATGGVLLGAGVTLIVVSLLQDDEPAAQTGLSVTPWVSVNGAGLVGSF
jgi:hypothetical protein